MFRVVSFCNLIGFSKFEEIMVDRKCTEVLPGPFPDFSGGAWGRGYITMQSVEVSHVTLQTTVPQMLAIFYRNPEAVPQPRMALTYSIDALWHYQSLIIKRVYAGHCLTQWPAFKSSMLVTASLNDFVLSFAPRHIIQQKFFHGANFMERCFRRNFYNVHFCRTNAWCSDYIPTSWWTCPTCELKKQHWMTKQTRKLV